ncbi:MAG: ribosome rescue protein RqcH [Methanofastidiosum sp.]|jgi:predicted ribosome quality control (RQC) complex YloA/Tae2 family protein|nr:ribosome rescue protein RqcH [Methanofastidiosum sp.]
MFSTFDLKEISKELSVLEQMRVDKIYQLGNEIRIKFFGRGREDLVIKPPLAVFVTSYPKPAPKNPTWFAMLLRKHLKAMWLFKIEQYDFDRILMFSFGFYEENNPVVKFVLIVEMFRDGNILLADQENMIVGILSREYMKDRTLAPKSVYVFPEKKKGFDIGIDEIIELSREYEIVKGIATQLNIGGLYAEEACLLAGVDKSKIGISNEEAVKLKEALLQLENLKKDPMIIKKNDEVVDILPYDLTSYNGPEYEKVRYESFSKALDEVYGKGESEEILREELSTHQKKIQKFERMLKSQRDLYNSYIEERELYKILGDLTYEKYPIIEESIKVIEQAKKNYSLEEIKEKLAENKLISDVDFKTGIITFNFDTPLPIELKKDVNENANLFYEKSKKMKRKIDGAKIAMDNTEAKLLTLKEEEEEFEVEAPKAIEKKAREWYERFRWFTSSEGHIVLGGRDSSSNEVIVKKYMEDSDIYFHADAYGAPHVIVKEGSKATDITLKEVAIFAVSFSSLWKDGYGGGDAYWVKPEQVTKEAPSGEYLKKGAFAIKGKRNYIKSVSIKLTIGITSEGKIICGPDVPVEKHTVKNVKIMPGKHKKESFAKRIAKILETDDIDGIVQALPPGGCDVRGK